MRSPAVGEVELRIHYKAADAAVEDLSLASALHGFKDFACPAEAELHGAAAGDEESAMHDRFCVSIEHIGWTVHVQESRVFGTHVHRPGSGMVIVPFMTTNVPLLLEGRGLGQGTSCCGMNPGRRRLLVNQMCVCVRVCATGTSCGFIHWGSSLDNYSPACGCVHNAGRGWMVGEATDLRCSLLVMRN